MTGTPWLNDDGTPAWPGTMSLESRMPRVFRTFWMLLSIEDLSGLCRRTAVPCKAPRTSATLWSRRRVRNQLARN